MQQSQIYRPVYGSKRKILEKKNGKKKKKKKKPYTQGFDYQIVNNTLEQHYKERSGSVVDC